MAKLPQNSSQFTNYYQQFLPTVGTDVSAQAAVGFPERVGAPNEMGFLGRLVDIVSRPLRIVSNPVMKALELPEKYEALRMEEAAGGEISFGEKIAFKDSYSDLDFNFKINPKLQAFGGITLQTQVANGYNFDKDSAGANTRTLISSFMSPGTLIEALGFKYTPVKFWWIKLGLGATRQTFMLNQDVYSATNKEVVSNVPRGTKVINEAGLQVQSEFAKEIHKNIRLTMRYLGFGPFNNLNSGFDSRFDVIATAKITKYISTNFTAISIFDKDQDNNWQLSQVFGVGLSYKL
jgi:hypothetical protein